MQNNDHLHVHGLVQDNDAAQLLAGIGLIRALSVRQHLPAIDQLRPSSRKAQPPRPV